MSDYMDKTRLLGVAVRLSSQQKAVLLALIENPPSCPTTILRDVHAEYFYDDGRSAGMAPIGEPVGAVLRRLERRGMVMGEMGRDCKEWWITDAGLAAMGLLP